MKVYDLKKGRINSKIFKNIKTQDLNVKINLV